MEKYVVCYDLPGPMKLKHITNEINSLSSRFESGEDRNTWREKNRKNSRHTGKLVRAKAPF